jgi:hypothetical protein
MELVSSNRTALSWSFSLWLSIFLNLTADISANGGDVSLKNEVTETTTHEPGQTATKAATDADAAPKKPLQGYAKQDSKGTPSIPEWKMQAGYDELLGRFYVGFLGFKLKAVNGPGPGPLNGAVLGNSKLEKWKGHRPHPCLLRFTKLTDGSGGYYFKTVGSEDGPRGWIIPQPLEPHQPRDWAIYFMQ